MSTENQYSSEDEDQYTCHTCGDSLHNDDEDLCKDCRKIKDEHTLHSSGTCNNCGDSLCNDELFDVEDLCKDCRKTKDKSMSELMKDKRITGFMKWQMELFIQLKAKKITHAEGMKMMKEKYPEFTDDSEDESD